MTTKEALYIKKAVLLLSDFTGMEPINLIRNICFLDKEKGAKFVEASNLWNEFEDETSIVKRGAMLGIEVIEN